MESKPKACCANCEWCDKNGYKCKRSEAFVEKWIFCTYYHGNGITPEQEIEQANKRIAELEADLTLLKDGKSHVIGVAEGYFDEAFKNVAPVAKPIVWEKVQLVEFGKIGKFQIQVYEAWENNKPEEKELPFIFDIYYGDYHSNAYITLECVKRFLTMEEAKQAAQDWLNKLVAECAVMGNPTPQFTADEIEAIRKIAQFMGVTVADSIIAKCDAMLKGAQK